MSDIDLLDCLLNFEEELQQENNVKEDKKPAASNIHTGDTDSSDDEDNRDFQNSKYNDFGKSIKQMLNANENHRSIDKPERVLQPASWKSKPGNDPKSTTAVDKNKPTKLQSGGDVYTDPIFGIRIINPLISHATLKEMMQGREAVSMGRVRMYVERLTPQKDWVVGGVIVGKIGRTSQKGNSFAILTLSDLHGDLKTISLFLFGSAYKELSKCLTGTVVGILNPTVFEKKKDSKDEACLSVDNIQRVLILGQSKDFGTCKSMKKNGDACTSFVNKNRCEFCVYHIKQEYQKCSKRSELQSNFQGKGLTALRNKVLGKNEVFYAGKSYMAIPAKKSQKLVKQDEGRLSLLSGMNKTTSNASVPKNGAKRKQAEYVESIASQRLKDMELLKRLGGGGNKNKDEDKEAVESKLNENGLKRSAEGITADESKMNALSVIAKLKAKNAGDAKKLVSPNSKSESKLSTSKLNLRTENSNLDLKKNSNENPKESINDTNLTKTNLIKDTKHLNKIKNADFDFMKIESNESKNLLEKNNDDSKKSNDKINKFNDNKMSEVSNSKNKEAKSVESKLIVDNSENNGDAIDYANILDENNFSDIEFDLSDEDLNINNSITKIKSKTNNDENSELKQNISNSVNHKKLTSPLNGKESKILTVNKNIPDNKIKNDAKILDAAESNKNKINGKEKFATSNGKIVSSPQTTNKEETKINSSPQISKDNQSKVSVNPLKTNSSQQISHNKINEIPNNFKNRFPNLNNVPSLLNTSSSIIDLNAPIPKTVNRAKINALQWVQKNGPIKKDDGKNKRKRALEIAAKVETESDPKKQKIQENEFFSDRFKKMMAVSSKHTNLVRQREDEEQEKYFNKLEMKERMEDKMMSIYKVDCKAVRCLQCKYTSFSAAALCKEQKHKLKVFDAVKRFFRCGDCGYRTVTLRIIPLESCKNCGSGKWERTTMMKEKKVEKMHSLSIRGGEQANVNSVITDANINLLVPDD